jgi:NAD-reducing hydrogenase small subunit
MRNTVPVEECIAEAYIDGPTARTGNTERVLPRDGELPMLLNEVVPCHEVVKVDYFLPGCPPRAGLLWSALHALVTGNPLELPYDLVKFD